MKVSYGALSNFLMFFNPILVPYLTISLSVIFSKGASWAGTPRGLPESSNPGGGSCRTTALRPALHCQRSCAGASQTAPCPRAQYLRWPHAFLVVLQRPCFLLFFLLILQSTAVPASAISACTKVHHHSGGPGDGIQSRACSCGEGRRRFRGSLFKQEHPIARCQTQQSWRSTQGTVRKVGKRLLCIRRTGSKWHDWV